MNWEVRITGDDTDLEMLARVLTGPEVTIAKRGQEFFLQSPSLDAAADAAGEGAAARAVLAKAREMVAVVSGALKARLPGARSIEVDHVVERAGDRRNLIISPEPAVVMVRTVAVTVRVSRKDGTVVEQLGPLQSLASDFRRAANSRAVAAVLRLRNLPDPQLRDLANIVELIQADGFAFTAEEKRDADRVTGSANHPATAGDLARHAAPKWGPPPQHKQATVGEAREIVDRLVCRWLDSKP